MSLPVVEIVGLNVRRLRKELGWSGTYLAKLLDIPAQHMSGIEHGKRGISSRQIEQLCEALACRPYELFMLPEDTDNDLIKKQLWAELKIMNRQDVALVCAYAVSLNASRGIKP